MSRASLFRSPSSTTDTERPANRAIPIIALTLCAACAQAAAGRFEGVYASVAGAGVLSLDPWDGTSFGHSVEARLGYSFAAPIAAYLSAALDSAYPRREELGFPPRVYRVLHLAPAFQYRPWSWSTGAFYVRGAVGLSRVTNVEAADQTGRVNAAIGLSAGAGLGVELALTRDLFLAPEIFYRNGNFASRSSFVASETNVQTAGLQLGLVYY